MNKVLWVVNYDDVSEFGKIAVQIGASVVAIRTDNDLARAIDYFHARDIQVFGWRWPSAKRDAALREADKVVAAFANGLDGYYVDPEGEPGASYDWNRSGLDGLANEFCTRICAAKEEKIFGVTSHYRAKAVFPKLPWSTFIMYADVFLPQAYWKVEGGVVGHGIPADNYNRSIEFWQQAGARPEHIIPMAGELASVQPGEIAQYAAAAKSKGIDELHFYTYDERVPASIWAAVAKLQDD